MVVDKNKLSIWLNRWDLIADGNAFSTHTSQLLPVKTVTTGLEAMLKVTDDTDEQTGHSLMEWWEGHGAAPVLAHENEAILLARATGQRSLAAMSREGQDTEACRILCSVANRLHGAQKKPWPQLTSLDEWFSPLVHITPKHSGMMAFCSETAKELLSSPRDMVVLHGDLHHGNVLDFASSGWLAIDPKGLSGERGFDFANIFTNPDLDNPVPRVATVPERFKRRLKTVTETAGLDKERLLKWIIAWCGLSAMWSFEDGIPHSTPLEVAKLAIDELEKS